MVTPFDGMAPAPDASEAQWAVTRMEGRDDVGRIVPSGFDAVRRVLFPLGGDRSWADEWPEYLGHGDHVNVYDWPPIADVEPAEDGRSIEALAVDALRPVLAAATTSPELCHYGVWIGGGGWRRGETQVRVSTKDPNIDPATLEMWRRRVNADYETAMQPLRDFVARCPVQPWWGGRDAFMFDGPVAAVAAIVSPGGQRLPQWWWPHDRSWFVGNEVDYNWIYVAGSRFVIDALGGIAGLESIEVEFSDRW